MKTETIPCDAPQSGEVVRTSALPAELDLRPRGKGFVMRGWDYSRQEVAAAIRDHRLLNPAMELGTNVCPWNCSFCFTESPENMTGQKQRLRGEMSLAEKLSLIDQAADLGARSINFVGAGEPTIVPDFWPLLEKMHSRSIVPIVYSEGALRLTDRAFAKDLHDLGATIVLKMNSYRDDAYQNAIVRGLGTKRSRNADSYTRDRNRALDTLLEVGFANSEPTRLAFDTIVCKQNLDEIPELHRFARTNNIFVLFVNYLPSGRSTDHLHEAISLEQQALVFDRLATIDREEHGIEHRSHFPYAGGVPCTIRGLGLFVKVTGAVFDCPGELVPLGDLRSSSLAELWRSARPITRAFDGGCLPRQHAWNELGKRHLPLLTAR